MNKETFFTELEECLRGQVSDVEYRDSVAYYHDYIRDQEQLGRTEDEILAELGSPRYIARSIIDARGLEGHTQHGGGHYSQEGGYGESAYGGGYNDSYSSDEGDSDVVNDPVSGPVNHALSRVGRTFGLIVALLVVGMALRFLLPVILIVIAVIMISNLFRNL